MGKVRAHIADDTAGIAQWVNRKLINHNPMSERDTKKVSERVSKQGRVTHVEGTNEVSYLLNDGREYKITVEEVKR